MIKLGIIGAMELEIDTLREALSDVRAVRRAAMTFYEGKLRGLPAVVVQCGIGKVNAGLCVQVLCDLFGVTHVINTGVAGSLDAELDIGDLVISTDALYHDVDVTALGYPIGVMPGMGTLSFEADEGMIAYAQAACLRAAADVRVKTGRVVSGDQFIADKERKAFIAQAFEGLCTEMEGAAIAHAARVNGLPFVVIRAISDKADDSAQMDYPTFERAAAKRSAALVEEMAADMAKA